MTQRQAYRSTSIGFEPVSRWLKYTVVVAVVSAAALCIMLSVTTVFNQQQRVKMGEVSKLASMQATLDSLTIRLDAKDFRYDQLLVANTGVRLALETCLEGL